MCDDLQDTGIWSSLCSRFKGVAATDCDGTASSQRALNNFIENSQWSLKHCPIHSHMGVGSWLATNVNYNLTTSAHWLTAFPDAWLRLFLIEDTDLALQSQIYSVIYRLLFLRLHCLPQGDSQSFLNCWGYPPFLWSMHFFCFVNVFCFYLESHLISKFSL